MFSDINFKRVLSYFFCQGGVDPFPVYCNLENRNQGIAISIVGHDHLGSKVVGPKDADGYHTRTISYNSASIAQLKALIKTHSHCLQGKKGFQYYFVLIH